MSVATFDLRSSSGAVVGGLGLMADVDRLEVGRSEYGDDAPHSEEDLWWLLSLRRQLRSHAAENLTTSAGGGPADRRGKRPCCRYCTVAASLGGCIDASYMRLALKLRHDIREP